MSTIFLKGHLDLETDTDGGQCEDTRGVWHLRQTGAHVCKDRQGLLAARRGWKTQKPLLLSILLWPCRHLEFTLPVSSTVCQKTVVSNLPRVVLIRAALKEKLQIHLSPCLSFYSLSSLSLLPSLLLSHTPWHLQY